MENSFTCSLIIRGMELDFENISREIQVQPTRMGRKGEPSGKGNRIFPNDFWSYEIEADGNSMADEIFNQLLLMLAPMKAFLQSLQAVSEVCIRLFVQSDYAQIGFDIQPVTIVKLAELGLRLEVSILSWGGVDDE